MPADGADWDDLEALIKYNISQEERTKREGEIHVAAVHTESKNSNYKKRFGGATQGGFKKSGVAKRKAEEPAGTRAWHCLGCYEAFGSGCEGKAKCYNHQNHYQLFQKREAFIKSAWGASRDSKDGKAGKGSKGSD